MDSILLGTIEYQSFEPRQHTVFIKKNSKNKFFTQNQYKKVIKVTLFNPIVYLNGKKA